MSTGGDPPPDQLVTGPKRVLLRRRNPVRGPHPWWWRLAGFLALAGLVALAGPQLLSSRSPQPDPPEPQRREESFSRTPRVTAATFPLRWPSRGNMPADAVFVRGALARLEDESRGSAHLLLAQRLSDGSRLVLASTKGVGEIRAVTVAVLVARPDTAAEDGRVSAVTAFFDPGELIAWAGRGADGHVRAVVLGRPAPLRVSLSPQVVFSNDGSASRTWLSAFSDMGLVVLDLGDRVDPSVAVRPEPVLRFPIPFGVRVDEGLPDSVLPPAVGGAYAAGYRGPDPDVLARAVHETVARVVDVRGADVRVVWSGVPWRERRMALVAVRRADGATFQALVGQLGRQWWSRGVRAVPRNQAATLPWLLGPSSQGDPTLLICPTGPGSLVYRRAGQPPHVLRIDEQGVAALVPPGPSPPSAAGARVTVLGPAGESIVTTTLRAPGSASVLALD